jgi:hypothetical protein
MHILRRNGLLLLAVALAVLLIGGCNYNVSYLVKNSQLKDVETVLKDYAGLSGYKMTYSNDETGAYRIVVNSALVPVESTVAEPVSPYGMQEERKRPQVERQVASLAITIAQQDKDVVINGQSTGSLDASDQFRAFLDYLRGKGYTVQEIKQSN